ncbi:hypothetical protein Ddye_027119 [Dipteronia dyeriana]|uniref:Uncharacterized protein n=1 Tax=Dipteronia dyeriana TaxID=168575 RepID=A0AAD9TNG9_9ROSI|nr:hypothetical protein Ddye_027119 [Dipteronia dyeriana]
MLKREQAATPLSVTGAPSVPDPSPSKDPDPLVVVSPPGHAQQAEFLERWSMALRCHRKAVNAIHGHESCVLSFHNAAVKNVKWSQQGHFVLSCGYDHSLRLTDVEKSIGTQNFKEEYVVRVMKFHPDNSNLFLAGGVLSDCGIY